MEKSLFSGVLSLMTCAGQPATEIASISFNFHSNGESVPEGKAPERETVMLEDGDTTTVKAVFGAVK